MRVLASSIMAVNPIKRFLRSKRLRNALFLGASGKCSMCGELLPAEWHADHIERFAETQRTNVHEMQPLCPPCHYKKTAMENARGFFEDRPSSPDREPRGHQKAFAEELKRINAGMIARNVSVLDIVPGGGKSALPQMGTWRIEKGLIDAIIWVVPWKSLKQQACEGFDGNAFNPGFGALDRENTAPLIPESDWSPRRAGRSPVRVVVTSYAGVASNPEIYTAFMKLYRCDIYLDEVQHLAETEDGESASQNWADAIGKLAPLAKHIFAMGGTLDNGQKIPFVSYETGPNDEVYHQSDIEYTFKEALRERAIIALDPVRVDGYAKFSDKGETHEVILKEAKTFKTSRQALRTCIVSGDYAQKMLIAAAEHFLNYQQYLKGFNGHSSKMLVVAPTTQAADAYAEFLEDRFGAEMRVAIAHTNISSKASPHDTIKDFKKSDGHPHPRDRKQYECLVTVGMAYEGLDVPDISHLVALTFTRTKAWITQMLARSWRVDHKGVAKGYSWELQRAFVFIPDDKAMNVIMKKLLSEQRDALKQDKEDVGPGPDGPTPPPQPSTFVPHTSDIEDLSYAQKDGERMSDLDSHWVNELLRERPRYACFPPHELIEMRDNGEITFQASSRASADTARPEEDHAALRKECQELAARIDVIYMARNSDAYQYGYANKQAVKRFRMKREEMGIDDLIACRDWLNSWLGDLEESEVTA